MAEQKILEELDIALADLGVLYIKLHSWHWHVQGLSFKVIHDMTEGYYEHIAKLYDEVAERMLQIGGKPSGTMKSYLQKAHIKELEETKFEAAKVVEGVLADFSHLHGHFNRLAELSAEAADRGTEDLAVQAIGWLEKQIWMLRQSRPA